MSKEVQRNVISFVVVITMVGMAGFFAVKVAHAQNASLTLSPSSGSYEVGQTFTLNIALNTGGEATAGVDVHYLHFDPTLLEVQDTNNTTSGVQIQPGTLYANTLTNFVDNALGRIDFSQVTSGGTTFSGSGTLATVTFKVKTQGAAHLTFDFTPGSGTDTNVASNGQDVLGAVGSASFSLTAVGGGGGGSSGGGGGPSTGSGSTSGGGGGGGGGASAPPTTGVISGRVTVNFFGTELLAQAVVVLNPGSKQTTTDSQGKYIFTSVAAGSYTLRVSKSGFVPYTSKTFSVSSSQTVTQDFFLRESGFGTAPGSLIKVEGHPAVYYLGADGKRYVFPNEKTYKTWYQDFSQVVIITAEELASYPIGGNVTYRPGTRLVKIQTDPKVYAVEPGGVLRWIITEERAQELFGENWNTLIDDVPDTFFTNYTVGAPIETRVHPVGALITYAGSPDLFVIARDSGALVKRKLADFLVFAANRLREEFILTVPPSLQYPDGEMVSGQESLFTTVAGP